MKIDVVSFTSVSSQCQIGDLNVVLVLQECGIDPASDLKHLTSADRNLCWPKRRRLSVLLGQVGFDSGGPQNAMLCPQLREERVGWMDLESWLLLSGAGGLRCQGMASQGQPKAGFTTEMLF